MSEYICLNKFDTNDCPNIFVNEKLLRTNVWIYVHDQYIRIVKYIFHTLFHTDIRVLKDHGTCYIFWKLWPTAFRFHFPKGVFLNCIIVKCIFWTIFFQSVFFEMYTAYKSSKFLSLFKTHYEEKTSCYLGNFLSPKADNLRRKSKTNKITCYIYDFCCGAKAEWVLCWLERIGNWILAS